MLLSGGGGGVDCGGIAFTGQVIMDSKLWNGGEGIAALIVASERCMSVRELGENMGYHRSRLRHVAFHARSFQ